MTRQEAINVILTLWKFIDRSHDSDIGIDSELIRQAFNLAIKALEEDWIPCSERLPEEYGNYLATMDDGDVQECTYSPEKNTPFMRGGWSTCEADGIVFLDIAEVIAWMPLPEPYTERR